MNQPSPDAAPSPDPALPAVVRIGRQLLVTWWLQLKLVGSDAFSGVLQVVWPMFFASTAFLVYRSTGSDESLVYAGLGASVMGMWSAVATTASTTLQRERWLGTLELVVSTPTPFALVLIPVTTAMATMGLYSVAATLAWGWLAFDIPLHIQQPLAFALSMLMVVVSIAMIGFLLSVSVVRYRTAWALGNLLEYPGWLLCGFLVPLTLLPDWVRPIAYALPPTWGMAAIRDAAAGRSPWFALGVCAALAVVFGVVAALVAETVLRSARRNATLSLT